MSYDHKLEESVVANPNPKILGAYNIILRSLLNSYTYVRVFVLADICCIASPDLHSFLVIRSSAIMPLLVVSKTSVCRCLMTHRRSSDAKVLPFNFVAKIKQTLCPYAFHTGFPYCSCLHDTFFSFKVMQRLF